MLVLALIVIELAIVVWAIVAIRREPRRASNAPLIGLSTLALIGSMGSYSLGADPITTGVMFVMATSPVWLGALILTLLASGLKMFGRGARSLNSLLGGLAGLFLIAVLIGSFWLIATGTGWSVSLAVWVLLVSSWLGFLFISMVIYQWLYSIVSARRAPDYIVVLGAGLADGKVGRLLAARVRRAVQIAARWQSRGRTPVLVMSGGQGDDEPRPESAAMAEYATTDLAVASELVLQEDASTNTEENLRFTADLVKTHSKLGKGSIGLAVTSNFHVLRTADLARRLGLPIQVAGAPVVWYYWPSGMLREFVAQLVNHKWAVAISTLVLTTPLPILLAVVA